MSSVYTYRKRPTNVLVRGPLAESESIETAHGRVIAGPGDYVVTDPRNGDTWPIKQHFLAANYEPLDPNLEARFKTMRSAIHAKIKECVVIILSNKNLEQQRAAAGLPSQAAVNASAEQVETLLTEYGDACKLAGADNAASQMRASYLALGDEIAEMKQQGIISDAAADRMAANVRMLVELFAPSSDTRRAVHGYTNGHKFDWEQA